MTEILVHLKHGGTKSFKLLHKQVEVIECIQLNIEHTQARVSDAAVEDGEISMIEHKWQL